MAVGEQELFFCLFVFFFHWTETCIKFSLPRRDVEPPHFSRDLFHIFNSRFIFHSPFSVCDGYFFVVEAFLCELTFCVDDDFFSFLMAVALEFLFPFGFTCFELIQS